MLYENYVGSTHPFQHTQQQMVDGVRSRLEAEPMNDYILVIDDEKVVRNVMRRAIEGMGLRVLTAEDGLVGLATFQDHAHEIGCVLLDLTIPYMRGELAFIAIRDIQPDMPIIIMTAYDSQEVLQRVGRLGLSGFLQKPFTINQLRDLIRQVIY